MRPRPSATSDSGLTWEEVRLESRVLVCARPVEACQSHHIRNVSASTQLATQPRGRRSDSVRRTVAEELVLLPVPDQYHSPVRELLILLGSTRTPVLAPVPLDGIERRLQCLGEEDVRQTVVGAVVHLDHPCRRRSYDRMHMRMSAALL